MNGRLGLSFALLSAVTAPSAYATTYTVISSSTDAGYISPLTKTDTIIQNGSDSRNRFTMHRVVRTNTGAVHKGTIILLPAIGTNFKLYSAHESLDAMQSTAAALALANYDVYGLSPRTAQIPDGGCSSGAFDCSVMGEWGIDAYLSDIAYIRDQAIANHPGEKPAIGGHSLGAILGISAVNASPSSYGGLLMMEGMNYSQNPVVIAHNTVLCTQDEASLATGGYSNEGVSTSSKTAVNAGEIAAVQLFSTPNPVFGTPTFTTNVANLTRTQFQYASFARVKRHILDFNGAESNRILRDVHCSLAGERTFSNNLAAFTGSIYAVKAGQAFGTLMNDTLNLFTGASSKQELYLAAYGHSDYIASANHATYFETPVINWLNTVVFP